MNRYIFFARVHQYGGIERNILALAECVYSKGQKPVLVCFEDRVNMAALLPGVLDVVILKDSNIALRRKAIRRIVLSSENSEKAPIFCFGVWGGAFLAMCRLSYILHYTDPPSVMPSQIRWSANFRFKALALISIWGAKRCVTMTYRNANELRNIFRRKFEVVYQGGVPKPLNYTRQKNSRSLTLISICRLTKSKNIDWAIAFYNACICDEFIKNRFEKIELMIVGEGPETDNLKIEARKFADDSGIRFLGFCSSDQIEALYSRASIALIPAVQGYGLPALEALYRGVPVLLNMASGVSEVLIGKEYVAVTLNNKDNYLSAGLEFVKLIDARLQDFDADVPTEKTWGEGIGALSQWW